MTNEQIINNVCAKHSLQLLSFVALGGGDINKTFRITTVTGNYFIKLNSAAPFPEMFVKEADGLNALRKGTTLRVPEIVALGEFEDQQYLILEWLEKAQPPEIQWKIFGEALASLHANSNGFYGYSTNNYIGSLRQPNDFKAYWPTFYAEQRIMRLVKKLFDEQKFSKTDISNTEKVCKNLVNIFPEEKPALLHGDLWSGNFMFCKGRESIRPSLFDPAVYFGHREMDIGMSLLFGGFDVSFYDAYHYAFPLENNWKKRITLTQLYPLLVHAVLFGGNYIRQSASILNKWS